MKYILFGVIFVVVTANIALADDVGITGEWIVENAAIDPEMAAKLQSAVFQSVLQRDRANPLAPPAPEIIIPANTFLDFTVNGSKLTGSIIRGETEEPILNGKISGNKITFTVREAIPGGIVNYYYTGRLSNDVIQFDVDQSSNQYRIRLQFTARRIPGGS